MASDSRETIFPQDASSEIRELIETLRKLGEFLQGSPCIDWQENRRRCADLLGRLARECPKSQSLRERLRGATMEIGGSEHVLLEQDDPERLFKTTFGDNLGCVSQFFRADPEGAGRHFHATGNADPFFYFSRWVYLNSTKCQNCWS